MEYGFGVFTGDPRYLPFDVLHACTVPYRIFPGTFLQQPIRKPGVWLKKGARLGKGSSQYGIEWVNFSTACPFLSTILLIEIFFGEWINEKVQKKYILYRGCSPYPLSGVIQKKRMRERNEKICVSLPGPRRSIDRNFCCGYPGGFPIYQGVLCSR
jgi:hypothetical protein